MSLGIHLIAFRVARIIARAQQQYFWYFLLSQGRKYLSRIVIGGGPLLLLSGHVVLQYDHT